MVTIANGKGSNRISNGNLNEHFDINDGGSNRRTWTTNYNEISLDKYKQVLWKKVLPMLEIAGYDVKLIESKLNFN